MSNNKDEELVSEISNNSTTILISNSSNNKKPHVSLQRLFSMTDNHVDGDATILDDIDEPAVLEISSENGDNDSRWKGWTFYLLFSILSAILGTSFITGFQSIIINAPYDVMSRFVNCSFNRNKALSQVDAKWPLVVSLFAIGGLAGSCLFPAALTKRFGLNGSLVVLSPIGVIGGILCTISQYFNSHVPLMVGRTLCGFHSGIAMAILPAFLEELPPIWLRGACAALYQLSFAIGLAFSNFLGVRYLFGTEKWWPALFFLATLIYVIHSILLTFSAESPKWLQRKKLEQEALATLHRLRHSSCSAGDDDDDKEASNDSNNQQCVVEYEEIQAAEDEETVTLLDFLHSRQLWWPLILSINLHLCQHFTGVTAVVYYASEVMVKAGIEENSARWANLLISVVNVVATVISALTVGKMGRRCLLLQTLVGMIVAIIFITFVLVTDQPYSAIAGFSAMFFIFSLGPGPITWLMTAEMFPTTARPLALNICFVVNWSANLLVGLVFPQMLANLGTNWAFVPFGFFSLVETLFLYTFLPETYNVSSDKISEKFAPGKSLFQYGKYGSNNDNDKK